MSWDFFRYSWVVSNVWAWIWVIYDLWWCVAADFTRKAFGLLGVPNQGGCTNKEMIFIWYSSENTGYVWWLFVCAFFFAFFSKAKKHGPPDSLILLAWWLLTCFGWPFQIATGESWPNHCWPTGNHGWLATSAYPWCISPGAQFHWLMGF